MTVNNRSPLSITYTTWQALFLREAITRLAKGRDAIWILLDPVIHILFLVWMFTSIRMVSVGGVDTKIWLMVGVVAYYMFKDTMNRSRNAVDANRALFTYRQVRPVDTVLVRAGMEGFLTVLIMITVFSIAGFLGISGLPVEPLAIFTAMFGLWLIGLGAALILSVVQSLVPELAKIIDFLMMPLYICSGVIFPISSIPLPYRDWLTFNPLVHGVEAARLGFVPHYHAISNLSIGYVYIFAWACIFLGLALHVRFVNRLIAL